MAGRSRAWPARAAGPQARAADRPGLWHY